MSGRLSLVLHGHFYQPPRENPWTGVVEPEANAAPDHDWNARIARECYIPLASIPANDSAGAPRINAYEWLSFDLGPTLAPWLEAEAPVAYGAMLEGDRRSRARTGFGNAVAMPYHHVILPLCSRQDKVTEVRWGIDDFRRRFGRAPEGLWLPETAVDGETLDVLAEAGIAFTILAPRQVAREPANGRPGTVRTPGGRTIAVFVYDGPLAHGVAFGDLLADSMKWERAIRATRAEGVVSLASDGETWGHHHKFGDLALGALIHRLSAGTDVRIENYAAVLAAHPPTETLELVEPSSWSCEHGVGRWRDDCGCTIAQDGSMQHAWRKPLREAIDWLVGEVHAIAGRNGTSGDAATMNRSALAAMTSCGWFFDDFAALEGRQVLRFAAHAIAHAGADAPRLEAGLLQRLGAAVSNDPEAGTGRQFYLARIKPELPA